MSKKYELTSISKVVNGCTVYRIKALKDFGDVEKGNIGGYIQSEKNLSQEDDCWIFDNAKVFGNARVYENARLYDNAIVSRNAIVYGNAKVYGNAEVYGNAKVSGNAEVYGDAEIYGNAEVYVDAEVFDNAKVYGDAKVYGNAEVYGDTILSENANIESNDDFSIIYNFGSINRVTSFFKCEDGLIKVNCGCFHGTIDEFRERVKDVHKDSKYAKEYLMIADLMELKMSK